MELLYRSARADQKACPASPVNAEDLTIHSARFTCLAIETATELPSLALLHGGQVAVRESHGMRAPSRGVFEWVRELLDESGTCLQELDCIAYGAGPGSFTGARVAVSVAQALGYACSVPLCPVSSLAALAAGALRTSTANAAACCFDARMGEVYVAAYIRDREAIVRPVLEDRLCGPNVVTLPEGRRYLAAGPGWAAYPSMLERLHDSLQGTAPELLPSARDVLTLAQPLFAAGRLVAAVDALPNYLRDRVASESPGRHA